MSTIFDFHATSIRGDDVSLERYRGKVLLIVNVASRCGFTPQYTGLQSLYDKYHDRGLEILAFPCNQFGGQEPGSDEEVLSFCSLNYDVKFDLFSKVQVNGDQAHPLFQYLKQEAPGLLGSEGIKWNFTKFLVDRDGRVLKRFGSMTTPSQLESEIESLLAA
ncbi:MAG: glutathione peroxidase [Planctomycetes bacterium]|nr:glutathione peroxidase [Planctomycetota bacterium]